MRNLFAILAAILAVPFFLGPGAANAAPDGPSVVILPFQIHSDIDLSYMAGEIPRVIGNRLGQEGANILPSDPDGQAAASPTEAGLKAGADFVITGSLFWVNQRYSLDVRILDLFSKAPAEAYSAKGENIENLIKGVQDLAKNLTFKIFRREIVEKVAVAGNRRIEADAVLNRIKTKAGDIYSAKALSEDLRSVFKMGYFDDVRVEASTGKTGRIVTFTVKEKPTIKNIRIRGNRVFEDEEIKNSLAIRTGSVANDANIGRDMEQIISMYKDKNYHNVTVKYELEDIGENQADLTFNITEGEKVKIKAITFEGNATYTDKELKKLMKTDEKGFFSWLTSSGEYNLETLKQDMGKITAFYRNNGFIQARVADPEVKFEEEWIYIHVKIEEGPQYKVGAVSVEGDLVLPKEEIEAKLNLGKETFYNREVVRRDILAITDLCADEGYAYADVSTRTTKNEAEKKVDVAYVIKKGKQVYFEKILFTGNTRTRDKVLRRQMKVYEKQRYNGRALKRSVQNLYRLEYFEDVKVDTLPGSADDQMVLKIDVKEKTTGAFAITGGYSSINSFFVGGSVTERNLFGRGQTLSFKAELGAVSDQYTISFTEPWLFDIPLSAGADLFKWDTEYTTYDKDSIGGQLRAGYPVADFTRVNLAYRLEQADIRNVDEEDASYTIKDMEGEHVTSSVTASLKYDSRDRLFNPTKGSEHRIAVEVAGFGGDVGFVKYTGATGWYFPIFWKVVGFAHGEAGYVQEIFNKKLPDSTNAFIWGASIRCAALTGVIYTSRTKTATRWAATNMFRPISSSSCPLSRRPGWWGCCSTTPATCSGPRTISAWMI